MKSIRLGLVFVLVILSACKSKTKMEDTIAEEEKVVDTFKVSEPRLFLDLPDHFNSPASCEIDGSGNIYFTSPNLHNEALIKAGSMTTPQVPTIGKVDNSNQLSTWYTFKPEDMDKVSGKIAPFGTAFGPDGHLYVADMQLWFNSTSRILRIKVENGVAVGVEVVAIGTSFPNALAWRGNDLFISDTVLEELEDGKHVSGVYKVNLSELNPENPLRINPYVSATDKDAHLFETFVSNGSLKFGANGLAIDGDGNMYTGIMEDGTVFKTLIDSNGNKVTTSLFTEGMVAPDGLKWDAGTNRFFITDVFANAVYTIDMEGKLTLLAQNGNTDGADGKLDAPSEVVVRGDEIVIMNFDAAFDNPKMVNKTPDKPYTLSVMTIE